jgi:hypothetical protein
MAHLWQCLHNPLNPRGALLPWHARRPHAEGEDLVDGEAGKDPASLRRHGDATRGERARHMPRQHVTINQDFSSFRCGQAEQRTHERTFAGAVMADDAQHLLRSQFDADIEQHRLAAVASAQILGAEHGNHAARSPK